MGTIPLGLLITTAILVTVFSAVLMAAEHSLSRLSRAAVEDLIEAGRKRARRLDQLLERRRRTMLSARAVRIGMQALATVALTLALTETGWRWWGVLLAAIIINWVSAYAVIALIPQRLASRDPEGVALATTPLLETLVRASVIGRPVVRALAKLLPASPQTEAEARAEMAEEMREVVDQVGETEGFDAHDRQMLRSVFELGHTYVREVMVPRTDMVTLDADQSIEKALSLFVRSGYSRIPVIGEEIDDVVGIAYFKDVVSRVHYHPADRQLPVRRVCRPPRFAVEMTRADDELRRMQSERVHMCLVVDEYGGIAGLLTIEDLIEEVVGEVTDEHDRYVLEPEEVAPGRWRVPARYPIDELGELLGMEVEDEDVDSVGGLLAKAMGKVPLPGAEAEALGIHMEAEEAAGRRRQVATIIAYRIDTEEDDDE